MEQAQYPKKLPYWPADTLLKFCRAAVPACYSRGATILHPMMTNRHLFLVESGIIDFCYYSMDGECMTIKQARAGSLFGLKSVLEHEVERSKYFFALAKTDVKVWKLPRDALLSMITTDTDFSIGMIQYFIKYVDQMEKKMLRSAILDYYQHMILLLLDYAENVRNNTAVVRMTQQDLADLLNISRQSVSGYLKSLNQSGIISIRRGRVYILDWDALNMELNKELP